MIKVKNIRHTGIVVEDLAKSLWFYKDKLGFKIFKKMEESGDFIDGILGRQNLNITTVKLVLEDQMIELLDFGDDQGVRFDRNINDQGPTHLAFTVEDLDNAFSDLSESGVEFMSNPLESPDRLARVAFCKAPEGTYVELVELMNEGS